MEWVAKKLTSIEWHSNEEAICQGFSEAETGWSVFFKQSSTALILCSRTRFPPGIFSTSGQSFGSRETRQKIKFFVLCCTNTWIVRCTKNGEIEGINLIAMNSWIVSKVLLMSRLCSRRYCPLFELNELECFHICSMMTNFFPNHVR